MEIPQKHSIRALGRHTGLNIERADTSTEYWFPKGTSPETVARMSGVLVNDTVQVAREARPKTLELKVATPSSDSYDVAGMDDTALEALSDELDLFLDVPEMNRIKGYADRKGRALTDAELKTFGGNWSDHCCHKNYKAPIEVDGELFPSLIDTVVDSSTPYFERVGVKSGFVGNAGAIQLNDSPFVITIKVETHNAPFNIAPYAGAATCPGGGIRDVMALDEGGEVVMAMNMWNLASWKMPVEDVLPGCLHPEYLLKEGIRGVGDYDNQFGVPTLITDFQFDEGFRGKATCMGGVLGIQTEVSVTHEAAHPGDLAIAFGGRTGRDGIGGANFSSAGMTDETASSHNNKVQVGNPGIERQIQNLIIEASAAGCFRVVNDCGASGFESAIVKGIRSPVSVTLMMTNCPAFLLFAIFGAKMSNAFTSGPRYSAFFISYMLNLY